MADASTCEVADGRITTICDALLRHLNPILTPRKGLQILGQARGGNLVNAFVVYKETGHDKGTIVNFCPWCSTWLRPDKVRKPAMPLEDKLRRALRWDDCSTPEIAKEMASLGVDASIGPEGALAVFGSVMKLDPRSDQWTIPSQMLATESAVVGWLGVKIRDAATQPAPTNIDRAQYHDLGGRSTDYDDLETAVKAALDEHSDLGGLARALLGLGVDSVRPAPGLRSLRVGQGLLVFRMGSCWANPDNPLGAHPAIAAAIVKAHRRSMEVSP